MGERSLLCWKERFALLLTFIVVHPRPALSMQARPFPSLAPPASCALLPLPNPQTPTSEPHPVKYFKLVLEHPWEEDPRARAAEEFAEEVEVAEAAGAEESDVSEMQGGEGGDRREELGRVRGEAKEGREAAKALVTPSNFPSYLSSFPTR